MTARNPLVLINGLPAELPAGDTLNGAIAPEWWARITNASWINVTAATTATIDRMHVVSGTSADYDITLPAASSNSGKVVGFVVKDYTAASKQYRLDAGAGVKIAGRTRYLVLMHTNVALFISDGTDWQPLVLCLDTPWISWANPAITGTTTNPGKGTYERDVMPWCRRGSACDFHYQFRQTGAGSDGSGTYRVGLPFSANTSIIPTTDGLSESSTSMDAWAASIIGAGTLSNNSTMSFANAQLSTASTFAVQRVNDAARTRWGSDNYSLGGTTIRIGVRGSYPVTDW